MYGRHPSSELCKLFRSKPYQGADPESASIIFLGLDANYSEEISDTPFFERILEYHSDGVSFWQRYGVHHPFLLDEYPLNRTKGGVPYHRNFSKLELTADYADQISFVELLDIPTIGTTTQAAPNAFYDLVNAQYLKDLDELFMADRPKHIFTYRGVVQRMLRLKKQYGVFQWLQDSVATPDEIPVLYDDEQTRFYQMYSFSSSHIHRQLPALKQFMNTLLAVENEGESTYENTPDESALSVSSSNNENITITTETTDEASNDDHADDEHWWYDPIGTAAGQRVLKEFTFLAFALGLLSQSWWVFGLCLLIPILMSLNSVVTWGVLVLRVVAWCTVGVMLGQVFESQGASIFLGILTFIIAGHTSISSFSYFRG